MQLKFTNLKMHSFLSFGDAELDLNDKGYVLVEGVNNNPSDGALSNGSGKSSIWNAICWCLTGETINGLSKNIPNIHTDGNCSVTLTFFVDKDEYIITRTRSETKGDIKIIKNSIDISGKGLRGSEEVLANELPDLTSNLIGNVIILGQGLPHKFTDNTPAGRKEVLEQLSQSDFMIKDVKDRIARRSSELDDRLRRCEDELLANQTSLSVYKNQLEQNKKELEELVLSPTINEDIEALNAEIEEIQSHIDIDNSTKNSNAAILADLKNKLQEVSDKFARELMDLSTASSGLTESINAKKIEVSTLTNEIRRLDAITDTCPTCGHKLEGVEKPDTTDKKNELNKLNKELNDLIDRDEAYKADIRANRVEIENAKVEACKELNEDILAGEKVLKDIELSISEFTKDLTTKKIELNNLVNTRDNYANTKARYEKVIADLTQTISETDAKILYNIESRDKAQEHVDTLTKINSLVKRDFRGLLLTNVIDFINAKAKEYCTYVFNTDDLNVYLDGNNLEIDFCKKAYANLSGGEKQKVDIVIQLAIRDMMCQYMNYSCNILVVDEIFDALDEPSCQSVLNLINAKLADVESLFIISHHSAELGISADDTIVIEKNSEGISRIR